MKNLKRYLMLILFTLTLLVIVMPDVKAIDLEKLEKTITINADNNYYRKNYQYVAKILDNGKIIYFNTIDYGDMIRAKAFDLDGKEIPFSFESNEDTYKDIFVCDGSFYLYERSYTDENDIHFYEYNDSFDLDEITDESKIEKLNSCDIEFYTTGRQKGFEMNDNSVYQDDEKYFTYAIDYGDYIVASSMVGDDSVSCSVDIYDSSGKIVKNLLTKPSTEVMNIDVVGNKILILYSYMDYSMADDDGQSDPYFYDYSHYNKNYIEIYDLVEKEKNVIINPETFYNILPVIILSLGFVGYILYKKNINN